MNELMIKEDVSSRGMDTNISQTKFHDYFYNRIVTHYNINNPISVSINFVDAPAKLERSYYND